MKKILSLMVLAICTQTQALPLVSETVGMRESGVLTVYPDHKDPNQFYYFPNSSKFVRDQQNIPLFIFSYWGLDSSEPSTDQGAYMSFETRLDSDKEQKLAIQKWLNANPQAKLSALPVKSSTIGLTNSNGNQPPLRALFSEFSFSKVGGRAEDHIGINALLTGTGAKVFKSILLNEGSQVLKTDYCYIVQGLGPNFDASIYVNWKRTYEYFEANASAGRWFWKVKVKTIVEKLKQQGDVKITMNGGDATEEEYITKVSEKMIERLFVPELKASADLGLSPSSRIYNLNVGYIKKEELKEETYQLTKRELVEREFCIPVSVNELAPYSNKLVIKAD